MSDTQDDRLIFDRQAFLESCTKPTLNNEMQKNISQALLGTADICTTDSSGTIVSRFKRDNGAWKEEDARE